MYYLILKQLKQDNSLSLSPAVCSTYTTPFFPLYFYTRKTLLRFCVSDRSGARAHSETPNQLANVQAINPIPEDCYVRTPTLEEGLRFLYLDNTIIINHCSPWSLLTDAFRCTRPAVYEGLLQTHL